MTISPVLAVTLKQALVPVLFTVVGAAGCAYQPAVARIRRHVQHLAAGVVFAVVAVELLPEIQRRALVWDVVIGFALGIGTMLAVDKLLGRIRGDRRPGHATSVATVVTTNANPATAVTG